ncbi:nuclease-related domain-containing protein [Bacillus bombysepticus]|uniref:nuclease-related domain-containing protein n=1 Tax=Bacillus bombysepticus TaxID=658666 RepID=UPI00301A9887
MYGEEKEKIPSLTKRIFGDFHCIMRNIGLKVSILAFGGIVAYRVWHVTIPPGIETSDFVLEVVQTTFYQMLGLLLLCFILSAMWSNVKHKRETEIFEQKDKQRNDLLDAIVSRYAHAIEQVYKPAEFFTRRHLFGAEEKLLTTEEQESFFRQKLQELDQFPMPNQDVFDALEESIQKITNMSNPAIREGYSELEYRLNVDLDNLSVYREMHRQVYAHINRIKEDYKKNLNIIGSGNRGERRVNEELAMFDGFSKYMSNLRLEVNGQSIETDNVLFATKGIFLFEVKNFSENGKYSLRITKDGQWQRINSSGSVLPMDKDVTAQHNRHVLLMQKLIKEQWKLLYNEEAPVLDLKPIIVIANDKIMIENQTDLAIIRISQIYHHVQKSNDNLSQDTLSKLWNILETHKLPLKQYPVSDYASDFAHFGKILKDLEEFSIQMNRALKYYLEEVQIES